MRARYGKQTCFLFWPNLEFNDRPYVYHTSIAQWLAIGSIYFIKPMIQTCQKPIFSLDICQSLQSRDPTRVCVQMKLFCFLRLVRVSN